jgi:hypothetical protein
MKILKASKNIRFKAIAAEASPYEKSTAFFFVLLNQEIRRWVSKTNNMLSVDSQTVVPN